jgi:hypothetical protein
MSIKRGEIPMRRASTCLAVLGLALLALPGAASAAPEVTFKAKAVPITGYNETGNLLNAGAAVEAEYNISGTEYGGFPAPLIGVNFYLPNGAKIHPAGFPTCATQIIAVEKEPSRCPAGSKAGPVGKVLGVVAFGTTRVPEEATLESFYAPGGGLNFFTFGHSPVSLEIPSTAKYTSLNGSGGKGPELVAQVPLVETVPGAADASVEKITVKVGSAVGPKGKHNKKDKYYGVVPSKCPKGGFPIKTEMTFAGLSGLTQTTVIKEYKAPCPPGNKKAKYIGNVN